MLKTNILETIKKHNLIEKGDHIVIGLSGGPDSLCLFDILYTLREKLGITLEAVHVNHGLRPLAADEDQRFVEEFCANRMIACHSFSYDCNAVAKKLGMSSEQAGRMLRYEAFDKVAESFFDRTNDVKGSRGDTERVEVINKDFEDINNQTSILTQNEHKSNNIKIAVAQNANDQVETLLFRLIRGTGIDGLAGISYSRKSEKGFDIIRPLLDVTRDEIEKYCIDRELHPCIDKTNAEPLYTRNKIRLELLPYLQSNLNSDVVSALTRLSRSASEDKDYFWKETESAFEKAYTKCHLEEDTKCRDSSACEKYNKDHKGNEKNVDKAKCTNEIKTELDEISLDLEELQSLHKAIRHRVILKAFARLGLECDIERVHLEASDNVIEKGNTGLIVDFPHGYRLGIFYGMVVCKFDIKSQNLTPKAEKIQNNNAFEHLGIVCELDSKSQYCGFTDAEITCDEKNGNIGKSGNAGKYASIDKTGIIGKSDSYVVKVFAKKYFTDRENEKEITEIQENLKLQELKKSPKCKKTKELVAIFDKEALTKVYGSLENLKPMIRTRQNGDYIALTGGGKKKIQDLFVDKKIRADKRDNVPMVCIGQEVLLIIGDEFSGLETGFVRTRYTGAYKIKV